MEITNDILAAYVEGHVSDEERKAVRQYLVENPSAMEDVLVMLDEDFELEPSVESDEAKQEMLASTPIDDGAKKALGTSLCYSAAAFAPMHTPKLHHVDSPGHVDNGIQKRMDDLLSEMGF